MSSPYRPVITVTRLAVATIVALTIATPASAQFGGLKKRVKAKAGQEAVSKAAGDEAAEGAAPADQGGMIVLTEDVVSRLVNGLKAGQVERQAASEADTPYGRHTRAATAYASAKVKCDAAHRGFYLRMAGNRKLSDKHTSLIEKMVEAQNNNDAELTAVYQDSAMAMQDPSCVVKNPGEPGGEYYQAQREVNVRAEKLEVEASGFTPRELPVIKERADAILRGTPAPGGASPMEKSAVSARAAELKQLLGIKDQPIVQAAKPVSAPAPTPTPTAGQPSPQMSAAASDMSACMTKNIMAHQSEIEALGARAEAAQAAGNNEKLMAIADTLQRIQMAGCQNR